MKAIVPPYEAGLSRLSGIPGMLMGLVAPLRSKVQSVPYVLMRSSKCAYMTVLTREFFWKVRRLPRVRLALFGDWLSRLLLVLEYLNCPCDSLSVSWPKSNDFQEAFSDRSRMNREVQVRFLEGLAVRFRLAT